MKSLDDFLNERLNGAKKLAVLGAGSLLHADDAAGTIIAQKLQETFGGESPETLLFCAGETAPENFSGKLKRFRPEHLLVIDAADLGKEPGFIAEIRPEDVGGPTFCTHMLPLRVMIEYLAMETGTGVTLLGIQTGSIAFDGEMTEAMRDAVDEIMAALTRVIASM